jgi:hypothetical protein
MSPFWLRFCSKCQWNPSIACIYVILKSMDFIAESQKPSKIFTFSGSPATAHFFLTRVTQAGSATRALDFMVYGAKAYNTTSGLSAPLIPLSLVPRPETRRAHRDSAYTIVFGAKAHNTTRGLSAPLIPLSLVPRPTTRRAHQDLAYTIVFGAKA